MEALADLARAKGAIRRIGEELGVHPEALRTWVKKAQIDQGTRPGTTTDEVQRIKELVKEVRELRRANAILKSASACLSRRSVSARPSDLPVHRDQIGGVRGLAGLQGAHWRRSQDRPEHLTHARRSLPPRRVSLDCWVFFGQCLFVLQAAFVKSRKSLSASSGVRYPRAE